MAYTTIDDPSAHFQNHIYTGNGSSSHTRNNEGNSDLQPDLLWFKKRNDIKAHVMNDTSRGITKSIYPNETSAEGTESNGLSSVNTNGFTVGSEDRFNGSSQTYVCWQWKANGGTRTTNTESGNNPGGGYQANTTAGFSIVDYTGTGGAGTMAHGLGAVPELMIVKDMSSDGDDWFVYHVSTGNDGGMRLNTTGADADDSNRWNNTTPTSSVFTVGASGGVNDDGKPTIAYVFAPIQGYSKFGSYTGNGNADGPFVYTGFKPAWLMIKNASDSSRDWIIITSEVQGYNPNDDFLRANTNGAEVSNDSGARIDLLSNGFKIRGNNSTINDNSDTHIYMAFAEQPFVSSEGVPCTAR